MRADRLLAELSLLQVRGRMTAAELALELEVTVRTVYRDMYALQVAGVPLVAERGRSGGYCLFGGWRSDLTGLTTRELESLLIAAAFSPDRRSGSTSVSAAAKLAAMLPQQQADALSRLRHRVHVDPGEESDETLWGTLVAAVREGFVVAVSLERLPTRRVQRLAHPIGLIVDGRDWYFAWHGGDGKPLVDGQDAIVSVEATSERSIDAGSVDLGAIWRHWSDLQQSSARRYRVRLALDVRVLEHWRKRYPISSAVPGPTRVEVDAAFGSIHEARAAVLPWGGAVEVISPRALRLAVADFATQAAAVYADDSLQADIDVG